MKRGVVAQKRDQGDDVPDLQQTAKRSNDNRELALTQ